MRDSPTDPDAPTFACPVCGAVSHHPLDVRYRYCGRCHAFVYADARQQAYARHRWTYTEGWGRLRNDTARPTEG